MRLTSPILKGFFQIFSRSDFLGRILKALLLKRRTPNMNRGFTIVTPKIKVRLMFAFNMPQTFRDHGTATIFFMVIFSFLICHRNTFYAIRP
ncbi:MAG: hypothetical protein AUH37_00115 [Candidatus Nitrososphaera sp. 13_1_40CM_48_12]|nr:MAG: hypothetical protein AUH71_03035 [Thaumarchaeota archaeon 13_1_40CM_4_48_7]OLC26756.1 MAG: hypothetical protein AUH37_00115 [Candidatus Nitrososphaera sp. 13_1_40CM_48_12]